MKIKVSTKILTVIAVATVIWALAVARPMKGAESGEILAATRDGYHISIDIAVRYRMPIIEWLLKKASGFRASDNSAGGLSDEVTSAAREQAGAGNIEVIFSDGGAPFTKAVSDSIRSVHIKKGHKVISSPAAAVKLLAGEGELFLHTHSRMTGKNILILGMDGIDWNVINELVASGRLPNLERMIREGASGNLQSIKPFLSPLIWTTIATGALPEKHGVIDFVTAGPHGGSIPINSTKRKVPALWQMAGWGGLRVAFVGWLASWPAEPVNGFILSDRTFSSTMPRGNTTDDSASGKTWPTSLAKEIRPIIEKSYAESDRLLPSFFGARSDEDKKFMEEFDAKTKCVATMRSSLLNFIASRDTGLYLLREKKPELAAVYFETTDIASHQFMEFAPPVHAGIPGLESKIFSNTLFRTYEIMDEIIGEYLAAAGDEYDVLVISGYGFKTGAVRPLVSGSLEGRSAAGGHRGAGVIIALGPDIRKAAKINGASIIDITPTILFALGLPVATDMPGKILSDMFTDDFTKNHEPTKISSYDWIMPRMQQSSAASAPGEDKEALDKLKQLGYIGAKTGGGSPEPGARTEAPKETVESREHNNLGMRFMSEGHFIKAAAEFRKATESGGANSSVFSNLGNAYMKSGQFGDAEKAFSKAITIEPNKAPNHVNLGVLLLETKNYVEAERELRLAIQLDPSFAEAYDNLGLVYYRTGRQYQAVNYYRKAIALDDGSAAAHLNLGITFWEIDNFAAAAVELEKAFSLNPQYAQRSKLVLAAGISHFNTGNAAAAADGIGRALALDPRAPQAHFYLGLIAEQKGDTAASRREYELELSVFPGNNEARARLQNLKIRAK
jgi:predicted AlkP superfamily phosphohydrolase/phosphomutase/Flp pilus assembly protein TadD